jgi:DNA-binding MurR/RpiR family transcriptional regulator
MLCSVHDMSARADITAQIDALSPSEARVAAFLVENPHRVGHLSAARLAAEAGASDATVIRTVRRLGFAGLGELREALAEELSLSGRTRSALAAHDETSDPVLHLIDGRIGAVAALPERVADDDLVAAVSVLSDAGRVCIAGFGPAGHLAAYSASQWERLGVPARSMTATGRSFADDLAVLRPGDAVVLLAFDGATREVEVLLDRADALEVPVIRLGELHSGAGRPVAITLPVGRGDPTRSASHAPTLVVLEALALATAARHGDAADEASHLIEDLRRQLAARSTRRDRP